jgi:hypothetical protein
MSGFLTANRVEFAALLGPNVDAFAPAKLSPGGFVVPGDPWLEPGSTFGSFRIRLDGLLLVKAVNNETASNEVNDIVEAASLAILASDWNLGTISQPRPLSQEGDNVKYLAVAITATKPIRL